MWSLLQWLLGTAAPDETDTSTFATAIDPDLFFATPHFWTVVNSQTPSVHSVAFYSHGLTGTLRVRFFRKGTRNIQSEYEYQQVQMSVLHALLSAARAGEEVWRLLRRTGVSYKVIWKN